MELSDDESTMDTSRLTTEKIVRGGRASQWNVQPMQVDKVPYNIDGLISYEVSSDTRHELLQKTKDGRPWNRDNRTTWSGYKTVRYRTCGGSYTCPNIDCTFLVQFQVVNKMNFGKNGQCVICSANGVFQDCSAKKFVAFINDTKAHVFHEGFHTCEAKNNVERPVDTVVEAMLLNPLVRPAEIQSNAILSDLRNQRDWTDVKNTVKKLTNIKRVSNEKIKQKKQIQPHGQSFSAVKELRTYVNENDKFLIYDVSESAQYVFKTSRTKLQMAHDMKSEGTHFLNTEYCYFDGNYKRVKSFVTLTASVYHPLLEKQVPLATMECKHEDGKCIEIFWRTFNNAYREVNSENEKFSPVGWCTDMASANFNGLVQIYGEDVLDRVKGCEFHFRDSVNRKAKGLGENREAFKSLSLALLTSTTYEAYSFALKKLKTFIINESLTDLSPWLDWWDTRREYIFRSFTVKSAPCSNLAEVVHAGWKNRDRMGVSILDSCLFDIRDSLLLESRIDSLLQGSFEGGYGPNQTKLKDQRMHKQVEMAGNIGADLLDFGVFSSSPVKKRLFTTNDEECNPPKKKSRSSTNLMQSRLASAKSQSSIMKIRKIINVNAFKREYVVSSSTTGRANYQVQICEAPSCTCPDYIKNGHRVLCKHVFFILMFGLDVSEDEELLKQRYISHVDLNHLLSKNSSEIDSRFLQKSDQKIPRRTKGDLQAVLQIHDLFHQPQQVTLHRKVSRTAKCHGRNCQVIFTVGKLCLKVTGALTVPRDKNIAVEQAFYFCARKNCLESAPVWSNVRYPIKVISDGASDADKVTAAENLEIDCI